MSRPATSSSPSSQEGDASSPEHPRGKFWAMVLGSMGVVYGDIGTSPLYALKAALGHAQASGVREYEVVGVLSLLIWALIFTVTAKYVLFLMRADNNGEGGTLSLMALAQRAFGRRVSIIFLLGITGAALFAGDAIITPAISVLSAVEGVEVISPYLHPFVLPITITILISLFVVQRFGTERVATFFGPIMAIFFFVIALLGALHIADAPHVLYAFHPIHGILFLGEYGRQGLIILGLVFLSVTGAEALYADMGHFGRKPIQVAWTFFVLPALLLNYLGQGALVLQNPAALEDPFYLLAPSWALIPFVLLSTLATVIASQAVITGAFSLSRQAIQLGLLPRLEIRHTSPTLEGQIFVPRVNRLLLFGVLVLVLFFGSSSALASAYGIAVTGTMVVTTALGFFVVWKLWGWPLWRVIPFVGMFLVIDCAFLVANLLKFLEGGWVPLTLAFMIMIVLWTWSRGTRLLERKTHRDSIPLLDLIRMLETSQPTRVSGTAVFLTSDPDVAPSSLMHNLKHNKVLHQRVFIVCVRTRSIPRISNKERAEIEELSNGFFKIILNFGYMESPRVPVALANLRKKGLKFDIMTTSFFLGRRTLKPSAKSDMPLWQDRLFVNLSKQASNATDFFSIPSDRVVELGAQVTV